MKIKITLSIITIVCICSIANIDYSMLLHSNKSELTFENIEVMAAGEDISGHIDCWGKGSETCPIDGKNIYKDIKINGQ